MKFHLKMALSMLALLSLLFGIGGSMLISASFKESLEQEGAAAFGNYRMAWGTLQIVNGLETYLDRDALSQTMKQLYQQNSTFWTSLRLSANGKVIYEGGDIQTTELQTDESVETSVPGDCLLHVLEDLEGNHYLVLSGAIETNGDILCLTTSRCISELYAARDHQLNTYFRVFFVMCLLCGLLSYTVSRVLTSPLKDLSQATRMIASGHYAGCVRIRSQDEIGALSQDFNTMAEQLKADAEQRERYIEQLRQSVERQERFIGSFAHEMKTPMTSLIGYADLIRSGTLTQEEQAEAADYLCSEGKRLESLSRKLLELLVIRQHGIPLIPASPKELVEQFVRQLEPVYQEKGIRLSYDCKEGVCLIEPDLVWSLLLNLADNAQKSMENGGDLRFQQEMTEDGCLIRVLDSGRGIPPQALEHLTEAFYRADKARSRKQGGFGLGLVLCQEIAVFHNGSLKFANRAEGGACVTVELKGGRS